MTRDFVGGARELLVASVSMDEKLLDGDDGEEDVDGGSQRRRVCQGEIQGVYQ